MSRRWIHKGINSSPGELGLPRRLSRSCWPGRKEMTLPDFTRQGLLPETEESEIAFQSPREGGMVFPPSSLTAGCSWCASFQLHWAWVYILGKSFKWEINSVTHKNHPQSHLFVRTLQHRAGSPCCRIFCWIWGLICVIIDFLQVFKSSAFQSPYSYSLGEYTHLTSRFYGFWCSSSCIINI